MAGFGVFHSHSVVGRHPFRGLAPPLPLPLLLLLLAARPLACGSAESGADELPSASHYFSRPVFFTDKGYSRALYESAILTGFGGITCFNTSHCPFPLSCTLETAFRRYCADTRFITTVGRTLFDLTGRQTPSLHGCVKCGAPIVLADFGERDEFGAFACRSFCDMPSNSSARDAVAESYQTSNCRVECDFERAELLGAAALGTSPHFPGAEPASAEPAGCAPRRAARRRSPPRTPTSSPRAARRRAAAALARRPRPRWRSTRRSARRPRTELALYVRAGARRWRRRVVEERAAHGALARRSSTSRTPPSPSTRRAPPSPPSTR